MITGKNKIEMLWKVMFDLILYVPSTIFQLYRNGSSWVEPVLSYDKCVLLKDHKSVTSVRLKPAALWSRSKHSTTEPLGPLNAEDGVMHCCLVPNVNNNSAPVRKTFYLLFYSKCCYR